MHQRMVHATHFNNGCAKLSTSFILSYGSNRPDLNSTDYKIYGVYINVNMSCKPTKKIKKESSSDWWNTGKATFSV